MQTVQTSLRATLLVATLAALAASASAADHKDAPLIAGDPSCDINDLYAFTNPTDPSRLVLAMTVNPFSAPSEGTRFRFSPFARYRFNIDNDGDARADETITVSFRDTAMRVRFSSGLMLSGTVTLPTVDAQPNSEVINQDASGVTFFAGPRDDPFFFDVAGFDRFLAGTGTFTGADGFAGYNCSAIVLELPASLVSNGSSTLGVWADTARHEVTLRRSDQGQLERHLGPKQQIDRIGNPAISVLVPAAQKDFYNIGLPENDATDFAAGIVATLQALGTDSTNINILASVAVPDTLKIDLTQPVAYPNGRKPSDDVVDTLFFFIFNQTPVSDGAQANDRPFPATFPYLAAPFQA